MSDDGFDFDAARADFPDHWDDDGWPASDSTWLARPYPPLRVRLLGRVDQHDVTAMIWSGDLDGLRLLFTYEPGERWNINASGLVYAPAGIDPEGHWRPDDFLLEVTFARSMFGGPDTWHVGFEGLPFFEPVLDWDD
jgi:hypothetical protein